MRLVKHKNEAIFQGFCIDLQRICCSGTCYRFGATHPSIVLFNLSIKSMFCSDYFFGENFKLYVFSWFFSKGSSFEMFKNGYISSEHLIQYQTAELFWDVCVLILLHLTCTQMLQLSQWTRWCEFATGLQQILHGNLTTMELSYLQ